MGKKIIQGIFLGISLVLPGMSVGTALIIMGMYREFLSDLSKIIIKKYLPVAAGVFMGIAVSVRGIDYLLRNYPDYMVSFLTGMILSSVWLVFRPLDKSNTPTMLLNSGWALGGFLLAWSIASQPLDMAGVEHHHNTSLLFLFTGGLLTSITMLLPGLSGSSLLIMIGLYDDLLRSVMDFAWVQIIVFGTGVIAGMLIFPRNIIFVYNRFQTRMTFLIAGLLAGSTRALLPGMFNGAVLFFIACGAALVLLINKQERHHP